MSIKLVPAQDYGTSGPNSSYRPQPSGTAPLSARRAELMERLWRSPETPDEVRYLGAVASARSVPTIDLVAAGLIKPDTTTARLQSMSQTLHHIAGLQGEEWGYDADYLAPTVPAYEATWELVAAAATECVLPIPPVSAGPLGDGGLSLQWGGQERYVRLLMPPDPKDAYLYSQGPGVHFLDAARPELLARRITWLLEG